METLCAKWLCPTFNIKGNMATGIFIVANGNGQGMPSPRILSMRDRLTKLGRSR